MIAMTKKSYVRTILVGSLLALPFFANAKITIMPANPHTLINQTASDESLEKLMELQQFDKAIKAQNQQAINNLQTSIANLLKINASSPEKTVKVKQILNDFIQDSMNGLNNPTVIAQFKANYITATKATYNQQEVNAMIDFYSSPIGQQIVKKEESFTTELAKYNLPIMQHWQEDLLKNKMPKLFNDLSQLKAPATTK